MKLNDIKIPVPLQFSMDDIGWIEGRVPYWDGFQPTRTGIPRRHVLADYQAVNEIGKAGNMKICGNFVLGDWDRKGILKDVPCATKEGKNWKSSPYVDEKEENQIRDFLNSCEYLEMAFHGLMHECWDEDGNYMSAEFVPPYDFKKGDKSKARPAPEWYLRAHIEAFMEIYKDWGFTQKLRVFTCPGHCFDAWKEGMFTRVIKEYGLTYWNEPHITHPIYENGVMLNNEVGFLAFWEAYDVNPDKLPLYTEENAGIICCHWPNFLRLDPDLNFENLDKWKNFFARQKNVFGVMLSRDIAFAYNQLFYRHYCEMSEDNGVIKIDFTKLDEATPEDFDAPIYISIKDGVTFECDGGAVKEYEKLDGFTTYEIKRNGNCAIYLK